MPSYTRTLHKLTGADSQAVDSHPIGMKQLPGQEVGVNTQSAAAVLKHMAGPGWRWYVKVSVVAMSGGCMIKVDYRLLQKPMLAGSQ
jgi:hypothetical protein